MGERRGNGPSAQTARGVDLATAAALMGATAVYLFAMPQDLGFSDESFFLFEAKRIRQGEVPYRDIFELVTPLAWYVMALLFALFGTTMETARGSMAVLHGVIAAAAYFACRRLGIGGGLAVAAAAAHVALCQPVWPYASPHWFGTSLNIILLAALLDGSWARSPRRALVPGVLCGLLIGVQQQKGVVLGAGVVVTFVADHLVEKWHAGEPWRVLGSRLVHLAAGALAVTVPLFTFLIAVAGAPALYEALIRFPLQNYRGTYRSRWAALTRLTQGFGRYTIPALLAALPLGLALPALEAVAGAVRRAQRERVRDRMVLAIIGAFSILSIAYYPDLIHVAFIGSVLLVGAAATLESILSWLPSHWPRHVVAALLLSGLALQLHAKITGALSEFPVSYESAFGRIDLRETREVAAFDEMRRLLEAEPGRQIFAYPGQSYVYLLEDATNPTRFQFFSSRYNDPAQIAEVLSALEEKKVRYVLSTAMFREPGDPIRKYLRENFERVRLPGSPRFWLLRRRAVLAPQS